MIYEKEREGDGHLVYVGLANGEIHEFRLSNDLNRFERKRTFKSMWLNSAGYVNDLHTLYAKACGMIFQITNCRIKYSFPCNKLSLFIRFYFPTWLTLINQTIFYCGILFYYCIYCLDPYARPHKPCHMSEASVSSQMDTVHCQGQETAMELYPVRERPGDVWVHCLVSGCRVS